MLACCSHLKVLLEGNSPRVDDVREQEREPKMEVTFILLPNSEVTLHHLCHILFHRNESLISSHTKERRVKLHLSM